MKNNKLSKMSPDELNVFRSELLQRFRFKKTTGELVFRKNARGVKAGKVAGHKSRLGYVQIGFQKSLWLAHQLIWLMEYNEVQPEIDHKNLNPSDNRLCNLRAVTHAQNNWNQKERSNNSSGHRGVSKSGKKWRAYITVNKSGQIHLGRFSKMKDAINARLEAEKEHFGEYAYEK